MSKEKEQDIKTNNTESLNVEESEFLDQIKNEETIKTNVINSQLSESKKSVPFDSILLMVGVLVLVIGVLVAYYESLYSGDRFVFDGEERAIHIEGSGDYFIFVEKKSTVDGVEYEGKKQDIYDMKFTFDGDRIPVISNTHKYVYYKLPNHLGEGLVHIENKSDIRFTIKAENEEFAMSHPIVLYIGKHPYQHFISIFKWFAFLSISLLFIYFFRLLRRKLKGKGKQVFIILLYGGVYLLLCYAIVDSRFEKEYVRYEEAIESQKYNINSDYYVSDLIVMFRLEGDFVERRAVLRGDHKGLLFYYDPNLLETLETRERVNYINQFAWGRTTVGFDNPELRIKVREELEHLGLTKDNPLCTEFLIENYVLIMEECPQLMALGRLMGNKDIELDYEGNKDFYLAKPPENMAIPTDVDFEFYALIGLNEYELIEKVEDNKGDLSLNVWTNKQLERLSLANVTNWTGTNKGILSESFETVDGFYLQVFIGYVIDEDELLNLNYTKKTDNVYYRYQHIYYNIGGIQ